MQVIYRLAQLLDRRRVPVLITAQPCAGREQGVVEVSAHRVALSRTRQATSRADCSIDRDLDQFHAHPVFIHHCHNDLLVHEHNDLRTRPTAQQRPGQ